MYRPSDGVDGSAKKGESKREARKGRYHHTSLRRKRDTGESCEPDSSWVEACNVCVCRPEGVAVCTRLKCARDRLRRHGAWSWRQAVAVAAARPRKCTPFEMEEMEDGCNVCVCNGRGNPICTQMECRPRRGPHDEEPQWDTEPRMHYGTKPDHSGVSLDISTSSSSSSSRIVDECQPGSRWRIECEECLCNENKTAVCETMPSCDQESDSTETKQKTFDGDMIFKESRKREKEEFLKRKQARQRASRCLAGAEWRGESDRRGCSKVCRCNEEGAEECRERCRRPNEPLRRLPAEEEMEEEEGAPLQRLKCKPNSEWMEQCNRCTCNTAGRKVCTELHCGGG